jgi:hypothetical protein
MTTRCIIHSTLSIRVEKKNTGKIRVCIDFRNLNKTTHKDEYPMHIADILINNASEHLSN